MKTARSNRQTEHRVLARPLGGSIAQASDADAARQSPFDGCLHQFRREEGERDRHIDLSNATFFTCSHLLDAGNGACNHLSKPPELRRCFAWATGALQFGRPSSTFRRSQGGPAMLSDHDPQVVRQWEADRPSRFRMIQGCPRTGRSVRARLRVRETRRTAWVQTPCHA